MTIEHPYASTPAEGRRRESIEVRVRYAETDQMGVVYHTHYLVWCEVARTEYMRRAGISYSEIEAAGTFLAVAEAQIRYHAAARYDDEIRIDAWIGRVQSRAITFGYEVWRQNGTPRRLVSATTRLVALDRGGAPRAMPQPLLERLDALAAAV